MVFQKEKQLYVQENIEVKPNFTTQEFLLWYKPFLLGQKIFNQHVSNGNSVIPLHLYPSYNGKLNMIAYVEEENEIIITFEKMEKMIRSIKEFKIGKNNRSTSAHLIRMGVYTTPVLMPVFTAIEESAHAHFHLHIKQTLNPEDISYTGRYDGSDSSEEYAFKLMSQIILMNKSLELFPLPDNFSKKLELFNI
jgi:hypothetical protein